jgi:cyanophycin synthetase
MLASRLRSKGIAESAIRIIPDEQEAIDAALRMAEAGDLLLVFGDALARSWKQITKFNPENGINSENQVKKQVIESNAAVEAWLNQSVDTILPQFEGVSRDERGIVILPEQDD